MRIFKLVRSIFYSIFKLRKQNIKISPLAYFDENCVFNKNIYIDRFCNLHNVTIDQFSYIGYGTAIENCKIGKFCSIGADIKIGLGKHPTNYVSTSPVFYSHRNRVGLRLLEETNFQETEEIRIGNDVWVGSNAIIMGGIKIGDGAIIAAGSIVTKDVEPYAIVGGVPAKVIRMRIPKDQAEKVNRTQWWNWDEQTLIDKVKDFQNVDMFVNKYTSNSTKEVK